MMEVKGLISRMVSVDVKHHDGSWTRTSDRYRSAVTAGQAIRKNQFSVILDHCFAVIVSFCRPEMTLLLLFCCQFLP